MIDYVVEQSPNSSKFKIYDKYRNIYIFHSTFVSHNKNIFIKMHSFAAVLHLVAAVTQQH